MSGVTLYDRNGAAFRLDHEIGQTAYVRPMVKVFTHVSNYQGDDFDEIEDYEPASYLVALNRAELFDTPPIEQVNADVSKAQAELKAVKADAEREARRLRSERAVAESQLQQAKRQLDDWMSKHRSMIDLGKLLDGKVLYPLSVRKNHYHKGRDIPLIPKMKDVKYLSITSGDFENGQKWVQKHYMSDHYGSPFQFFDTEKERDAVVAAEFAAACDQFRKAPNFDTTSHTSGTTLHYGTLSEWVEVHQALSIPEDIKAMKDDADAKALEAKRAKLAAELAAMGAKP